MVTVIDYALREAEQGEEFYALIVQGGVEMVESQSGNFYATARKASVPSTFDEMTCKGLIGQQIPGSIERVETDPYEYTVERTGEVVTLSHTYRFVPNVPKRTETTNAESEADLVPDEAVF